MLSDRNKRVFQDLNLEIRSVLGERARIHTEFTAWINSLPNPATVHRDYFLAQLDRICSAIDTDISPTRTDISSSHTNISPSHVSEFPMITDDRNSEEPR